MLVGRAELPKLDPLAFWHSFGTYKQNSSPTTTRLGWERLP